MIIPRMRRLFRAIGLILLCVYMFAHVDILLHILPSPDRIRGPYHRTPVYTENDSEHMLAYSANPSSNTEHALVKAWSNFSNPVDTFVQARSNSSTLDDLTQLEGGQSEIRASVHVKQSGPSGIHDRSLNASASSSSHNESRPETWKEIYRMRKEVLRINGEQDIHNVDKFDLHLNSSSVVLVIQVHDRLEYLQLLLESLRHVEQIERTLLIVSHDVYSEPLNALVNRVDYCQVLQIFFPYSIQLHPTSFPGTAADDCPSQIKKTEALKRNCTNAKIPDTYGHYREAKFCQTKHHWLWKLSHVFDGISVMKDYRGLVLLLEEDYYVTPDIITVATMMETHRDRFCDHCKLMSLGNYDKHQRYGTTSGLVAIEKWTTIEHNMGMAFKRDMWEAIKKCAKEFCTFDDYNWDWTVQQLLFKCIPGNVHVLKVKATRVFHMGDCGVHHKEKTCFTAEKVKTVQNITNTNKEHLFPKKLSTVTTKVRKLSARKPNGGWADIRDVNMCMSFMNNNSIHSIG